MARAHFVKAARKDNAVVKKGESYWWWEFRVTIGKSFRSVKRMSRTRPKPSQLTQSEFLSQYYAFQERLEELHIGMSFDDIQSEVESIADELEQLGDEQQEKLQNMPDGLQSSSSGELLQDRADACSSWADVLRSEVQDEPEGDDDEGLLGDLIERLQGADPGVG